MDEDSLIQALVARLPTGPGTQVGPGDDAAVVGFEDGRVAITTDILVEGVHFRDAWSSGFDVGWRLAAQNLADAAAMGAVPKSLVVALAGPPDRLSGRWGEEFARGLAAYCRRWHVGVVGGDVSAGPSLVACGTALGDLEGRPPVLRSGARAGQVVAVSDAVASASSPGDGWALGGSAAGLAWLEDSGCQAQPESLQTTFRSNPPEGRGSLQTTSQPESLQTTSWLNTPVDDPASLADAAVAAYLRPDPPLDLGRSAALGGATAMMDISDGLGKDAARLARASGVRLVIDPASPALAGAISRWRPLAELLGRDPRQWVLAGGEDHALLATFGPDGELPDRWHGIGQVVAAGQDGPGVTFLGGDAPTGGWDHFQP
ncbi:MAG: hypothetical protein LBK95_03400 [Bifidobacteriaceae bacterium]|nr:hypothetical protein [Bifidobacteriaceae bacterium]